MSFPQHFPSHSFYSHKDIITYVFYSYFRPAKRFVCRFFFMHNQEIQLFMVLPDIFGKNLVNLTTHKLRISSKDIFAILNLVCYI